MREHWFQVDDHCTVYGREHGDPEGRWIVALHGLTRNADDFDTLAPHLPPGWRMLALDLRGRGRSTYDPDWRNYVPLTYVRDVRVVLQQAGIERCVFLGTSLGGLLTLMIGAVTPHVLAGAILNDIGCVIDPRGLSRIQAYTGTLPPVTNWDEAREQVKTVYGTTLPDLDDADFDVLARRSFAEDEDGIPQLRFDPEIGRAIRELDMSLGDLWAHLEAIRDVPVLLLRGAESDILNFQTAEAMAHQHPDLEWIEVAGRGHVPLLNESSCVSAIARFLGKLK
ncbi:MAG: alpha/beta hydrolase [Pseudomonadota bacterium]